MRRQYGDNLSISQLLGMRIRGVDEDLPEQLGAAGVLESVSITRQFVPLHGQSANT